jgi:hypothetical protein
MSLVLSLQVGAGSLTTDLRDVVRRASSQVGQAVPIPVAVANRISDEVTAQAVADVLEIRRRERSVPPEVLALHIG